MVVRKIIERILEEGQTSITITDTDIPGSLIRTYSNDPDLMPTQVVLTGSTLKIDYEAQTSDKYVAVELAKQGLDIIDNLTSTDTDAALSANQGKALKDLVDGITPVTELTELDDVLVTDLTDGDILKYDAEAEMWENYNMPDIPVYLGDLGDIVLDTVTTGQVLTYNGAYWTNEDPSEGGSIEYSTTEKVIGKWMNKTLYQKTIECGTLPNTGRKEVTHDVSNLDMIVSIKGFMTNGTAFGSLPYVSTGTQYQIPVDANMTNIIINTGMDRSAFTGYVTIQYTKTV